ncbi:MAG: phage tail assembly protein [Eubacteriales bacterium]|nr:phage tail assembly protein [Eubacteriales bacterium]
MANELEKTGGEVVSAEEAIVEEGALVISLTKPYKFEGKEYNRIDLTGLENIRAADMIKVNRKLSRGGNEDTVQELSLEYAITLASVATGQPIEFFEMMPPNLAIKVKNRVIGFLFRWG